MNKERVFFCFLQYLAVPTSFDVCSKQIVFYAVGAIMCVGLGVFWLLVPKTYGPPKLKNPPPPPLMRKSQRSAATSFSEDVGLE